MSCYTINVYCCQKGESTSRRQYKCFSFLECWIDSAGTNFSSKYGYVNTPKWYCSILFLTFTDCLPVSNQWPLLHSVNFPHISGHFLHYKSNLPSDNKLASIQSSTWYRNSVLTIMNSTLPMKLCTPTHTTKHSVLVVVLELGEHGKKFTLHWFSVHFMISSITFYLYTQTGPCPLSIYL